MKFLFNCALLSSLILGSNGIIAQTTISDKDFLLSDSIKNRELYLFNGLVDIIGKAHYAPPAINDTLSLKIFNAYLKKLDPDKKIFLQSDIDRFGQFKFSIDEEIVGEDSIRFYYLVRSVFHDRINELAQIQFFQYTDKWKPINKHLKIASGDSISWPSTIAGRDNRWNEILSSQYQNKYIELEKTGKAIDVANKVKASLKKKYLHYFSNYNDNFDETHFFADYINVLCLLLDPHTEYQAPVEKRKFDSHMSNSFFGIGVQIGFNDQMDVIVKSVISGMSAWKSKLVKDGEDLLAIGQGKTGAMEETNGLELTEIVDKIRGIEGSFVRLQLKDNKTGLVHLVTIPREKVNLDQAAVRSTIINTKQGQKIGFIYLPEFYSDFNHPDGAKCADDFKRELDSLNKKHIDGLVVDLRNNGGGSLYDVVKIAGYFIPSGPIVQVGDGHGNVQSLDDIDTSVVYAGPLVVLVNGQSASASEIFTAAMQDYKRGVVIGTNSYGKGTVQRQLPIGKKNENGEPEFGAIKLTFQKFYRINGGTTQKNGIKPNMFLPDMYNYFHFREIEQPSVLIADSVHKAKYEFYQAGTAALSDNVLSYNFLKDAFLNKLDSLAKIIAQPNIMWTDYADLKKQYSLNKRNYDLLKKVDSLPKESKMKLIPIGNGQNSDWYKEWMKSISSSRTISNAIQIFEK